MMAGSFGVKNILAIYEDIIDINYDFKLIIITGKNKKLYEKFKEKVALSNRDIELIYFTDEIVKYMKCADMIITKPGATIQLLKIYTNMFSCEQMYLIYF